MKKEGTINRAESRKTQDRLQKPQKKMRRAVIFASFVIFLSVLLSSVPPAAFLRGEIFPQRAEGELRLHFVDVGQGDCSIVEFPEGDALVIDAGDGSFENNLHLARYLKGLRPKSVSMFLTHADADHYGGFEFLLQSFGIETFYLPVLSSNAKAYRSLERRVARTGCRIEQMTRYDTIESPSGAYLVCLSPYSQGEEDENDSSAVLYLSYGGVRALFCADISAARENLLCDEYALDETLFDSGACSVRLADVEILKTAHHGSGNATCERFVSLLRPQIAVVSCGKGNAYSHPAQECIARLSEENAKIYRTDERGDIIISLNKGNYSVATERR